MSIDRFCKYYVGVQEHAALGNRIRDAAHLAHVLGLDDEIVAQQVGRGGLIDGLAPADVFEGVAALERRVLVEFWGHPFPFPRPPGVAGRWSRTPPPSPPAA